MHVIFPCESTDKRLNADQRRAFVRECVADAFRLPDHVEDDAADDCLNDAEFYSACRAVCAGGPVLIGKVIREIAARVGAQHLARRMTIAGAALTKPRTA